MAFTTVEPLLSITAAARRVGLSPHLLRAWERRYGAVQPIRLPTGERLYRTSDLERLELLRSAVAQGFRIGRVARLPTEELRRLAASGLRGQPPEVVRAACIAALRLWRPGEAVALLARAQRAMAWHEFRERVLLPVLHGVGEAWERSQLCAGQEHLFSNGLRVLLQGWLAELASTRRGPLLLASTPTGQRHEFGALLAALSAQLEGWRAIYLGPDLPPEDIAQAARELQAQAVALSALMDPADPSGLADYLTVLNERLPRAVTLLLGGRGFIDLPMPVGTRWLPSFHDLGEALAELAPISEL